MFVRCKSCEKIYIGSMADILEEGWGIITGTAKEGYKTVYLCPECKEAYDSISESPGKGIEEMEIAKRTLNAFYGNKNTFASQCFNSACSEKSSKTQTWKEFCEEENKRCIKDLEKESQSAAKNFGGDYTLRLPKNEKLVMITWKDDSLWYLTKPMTEDDVAETYKFQESSDLGIMEGTVTVVETKGEK